MGFDNVDKQFRPKRILLECCWCSKTDGVAMEDAKAFDAFICDPATPDDPNGRIPLCRSCASLHHHYWDQISAVYNKSHPL